MRYLLVFLSAFSATDWKDSSPEFRNDQLCVEWDVRPYYWPTPRRWCTDKEICEQGWCGWLILRVWFAIVAAGLSPRRPRRPTNKPQDRRPSVRCCCTTCVETAANRPETPAVDNNLQASFKNLFISASFFSGDTVLTV